MKEKKKKKKRRNIVHSGVEGLDIEKSEEIVALDIEDEITSCIEYFRFNVLSETYPFVKGVSIGVTDF